MDENILLSCLILSMLSREWLFNKFHSTHSVHEVNPRYVYMTRYHNAEDFTFWHSFPCRISNGWKSSNLLNTQQYRHKIVGRERNSFQIWLPYTEMYEIHIWSVTGAFDNWHTFCCWVKDNVMEKSFVRQKNTNVLSRWSHVMGLI